MFFFDDKLGDYNWGKSKPHSFRKFVSGRARDAIQTNCTATMLECARQCGQLALNPMLSAEHRRHAFNSLKRLKRVIVQRPDFVPPTPQPTKGAK